MAEWFDPRALFGDQHLSAGDMLPLQSSAFMPAPSSPKVDNSKDLPMVPQGSLKDALLGKFDDPHIPSGIPTDEQEKQAFTHRLIGNATGDIVSNLQNTANILKPGAGNPAMGDSSRKFGDMLAQRALGNAQQHRQEAFQNFQLQDAADQRHEKMYQMASSLMQQRNQNDPNSADSAAERQAAMQRNAAYRATTQNPQLLAQLDQQDRLLGTMSAAQIKRFTADQPIGDLAKLESAEKQANAKLQGENANHQSEAERRKDETALGWSRLKAEQEHWNQESKDKEGNKSKLQLNEDKKAEEDIANLRNAKAELDRHVANLKNNVVSNDKPSVYGNASANFVSSLGIPGVSPKSNPALQDMLTSIPLAQATAEKAVTGSSRYSPQRWAEFAVQPGEGTQKSLNKLQGGSRFLDELIKERMTQLHTNASGEPTSQSAMAKALPSGAIPKTANEVQAHTQSGQSSKDDAALQWANAHPNDPRAKAIKQHLGVQ